MSDLHEISIDGVKYSILKQDGIGDIPDSQAYARFFTNLPIFHQYVVDPDVEPLVDYLVSKNNVTLVDKYRLTILKGLLLNSKNVQGEVWECGVYRGGTARFFADLIEKYFSDSVAPLRLFDTFRGMPETDPDRDIHRAGDFADTSVEIVKETVGKRSFVHYHPGYVPDTFSGLENSRIRFIHIDLDIYHGIKSAVDFAYARMPNGGIMLFDDYGFASCPGARQAVDEFFIDKPEVPVVLPTGQAFAIRQG